MLCLYAHVACTSSPQDIPAHTVALNKTITPQRPQVLNSSAPGDYRHSPHTAMDTPVEMYMLASGRKQPRM